MLKGAIPSIGGMAPFKRIACRISLCYCPKDIPREDVEKMVLSLGESE